MKSILAGCLILAPLLSFAADEKPALSDYFGFRELEIVKVTERAGSLLAGDVNHDGLIDLVIADNMHHRIDLWVQRNAEELASAAAKGKGTKLKVNELRDAERFEQRKLAVDQEVAAVALGDFNGDGRTDLAYFGLPDKLIVRYQPEKGDWKQRTQQRIPDVAAAPWCLAAGDVDSNGLDDLVLLGKQEILISYQKEKGTLSPPVKLLNTSDKLGLVQVADLDGDSRHDLCYLAGDGLNRVLCCRLQSADGRLGPEYVFDLERPRAVTLRDVDGHPGHEVLTIDSRTGRLKMFQVRSRPIAEGELPERMIAYGFGKQAGGKDRDWVLSDVDGDGLTDLVVSDPGASRMILFRQQPKFGLDLGTPYPALAGIDVVRSADFNGDGQAEIVVHSASEKIVGVSRFQDGRLAFPQALPIDAEVADLEIAEFDGHEPPELAILSKSKKGKETEYQLQGLRFEPDGQWKPVKFGEKNAVSLALKGTPERLLQVDLNNDGRPDFVVFQGSSKPPQTFLGMEDGTYREASSSGGLGLPAVQSAATTVWRSGDVTGLLVAQENFARRLTFGSERHWQVSDQFNVTESNAAVAGAVAIDLDGQDEPELVLVDAGVKKLRLWKKSNAVYGPWREIDLVDLTYKGIGAADLNGDRRPDLAVLSSEKVLVLYSGGSAPVIQEIASFESQLEKVYSTDVVAGDLNGDGRIDLAVTDVRNHYIELLDFRPDEGLRHALYFRLFEQKSFAKEDTPDTEPREALVADVTGDGRADLVLLVHDRILIYPQDDGRESQEARVQSRKPE